MTQAQNMQKRYETPALTVYGRLEDITLIWSNKTATDNFCQNGVGSQHTNSGAFCVAGKTTGGGDADLAATPSDTSVSIPSDLDLIQPTLGPDLTGSGGS